MSGSVSKIAAERNQKALLELATKPGNGKHRILSMPSALYERHTALLALLPLTLRNAASLADRPC